MIFDCVWASPTATYTTWIGNSMSNTTVFWNLQAPPDEGTAGVREPRRPVPSAPSTAAHA